MTFPPVPGFIPVEVCSSVGLEPSTPLDQCMAEVQAQIAKDGVAGGAQDGSPATPVTVKSVLLD